MDPPLPTTPSTNNEKVVVPDNELNHNTYIENENVQISKIPHLNSDNEDNSKTSSTASSEVSQGKKNKTSKHKINKCM